MQSLHLPHLTFASNTALAQGVPSGVIDVSKFAAPSQGNGNNRIRLYETQPKGLHYPWLFIHRENAPKGGVGIITIYEDDDGKQYLKLLKMKRPPFGGKICLEFPGGLIGDDGHNTDTLSVAKAEVREETGFDPQAIKAITPHNIASAQGFSSELMSYAMTLIKGKRGKDIRGAMERSMITGSMNVPVEVFADNKRFSDWLKQMNKEGYLVTAGIFVGKALFPDVKNGKVDLKQLLTNA